MRPFFLPRRLAVAALAVTCFAAGTLAQVRQPFSRVVVTVTPDRPDWTYQPGAPVKFRVDVMRDGHQVSGATVRYTIGPETQPPVTEATAVVGTTPLVVDGGTMSGPGFLRLVATADVEGRTYRGLGTAGFAPDRIRRRSRIHLTSTRSGRANASVWPRSRLTLSGRRCPITAPLRWNARRLTCRTLDPPPV